MRDAPYRVEKASSDLWLKIKVPRLLLSTALIVILRRRVRGRASGAAGESAPRVAAVERDGGSESASTSGMTR